MWHGGREAYGRIRRAADDRIVGGVGNAVRPKPDDDLSKAGHRIRDEVAVGVGAEQRDHPHVRVRQFDAEHLAGLKLDVGPRRQASRRFKQVPRRHRLAVGSHLVFPKEDLMRRVGRVGLVLVDPWRGDVPCTIANRGAGHRHEVGMRRLRIVQRVVGLQRNVDRAVAAFLHQVQTMVEELPEQREPGIVRGRKTLIGGNVRQQDGVAVQFDSPFVEQLREAGRLSLRGSQRQRGSVHRSLCLVQRLQKRWQLCGAAGVGDGLERGGIGGLARGQRGGCRRDGGDEARLRLIGLADRDDTVRDLRFGKSRVAQCGGDGGRVRQRLVHDQVRYGARIGIHQCSAAEPPRTKWRAMLAIISIREADLASGAGAEDDHVVVLVDPVGLGELRERLSGSAPFLPAGYDIVEASIDRAQADRQERTVDEFSQFVSDERDRVRRRDTLDRGAVGLGDLYLLQDKREIVLNELYHDFLTSDLRQDRCRHFEETRRSVVRTARVTPFEHADGAPVAPHATMHREGKVQIPERSREYSVQLTKRCPTKLLVENQTKV